MANPISSPFEVDRSKNFLLWPLLQNPIVSQKVSQAVTETITRYCAAGTENQLPPNNMIKDAFRILKCAVLNKTGDPDLKSLLLDEMFRLLRNTIDIEKLTATEQLLNRFRFFEILELAGDNFDRLKYRKEIENEVILLIRTLNDLSASHYFSIEEINVSVDVLSSAQKTQKILAFATKESTDWMPPIDPELVSICKAIPPQNPFVTQIELLDDMLLLNLSSFETVYREAARLPQLFAGISDQMQSQRNQILWKTIGFNKKVKRPNKWFARANEQHYVTAYYAILTLISMSTPNSSKRLIDLFDYVKALENCTELLGDPDEYRDVLLQSILEAKFIIESFEDLILASQKASVTEGFFLSSCGNIYRLIHKYKLDENTDILKKAIKLFEKGLELSNVTSETINYSCFRLAECHSELNNYEEAIKNLNRLSSMKELRTNRKMNVWEAFTKAGTAHRNLARERYLRGDAAGAIESIRLSEKALIRAFTVWEPGFNHRLSRCTDASNIIAHKELALTYLYAASYDKNEQTKYFKYALAQAKRCAECESWDPRKTQRKTAYDTAQYIMGVALLKLHQNPEAIDCFNGILKRGAENPEYERRALVALALLYRFEGEIDKKIAALERLFTLIGDMAKVKKNFEKLTESQLAALIGEGSMANYIRDCRARIKARQASLVLDEISPLIKVAQLLNFEYRADAVLLTIKGMSCRQLGQFDNALICFKAAYNAKRQSDKNRAITLLEIGKTCLDMGEFGDAARAFESSYEIDGESAPLLLAATARRHLGDFDKAIDHLETLLASPFDLQPNKTRTALAMTLWKRHLAGQDVNGARQSANVLLDLLEGDTAGSWSSDPVAINLLVEMSRSNQSALDVLEQWLSRTSNAEAIRVFNRCLMKYDWCPTSVLGIAINRLRNVTDYDLEKSLIKICSRSLEYAYLHGAVEGKEFLDLGKEVFGVILYSSTELRKRRLLELFASERDVFLAEMMRHYKEDAEQVLAPLFLGPDEVRQAVISDNFRRNVRKFLEERFPASIFPKCYGSRDRIDLATHLQELFYTLNFGLRPTTGRYALTTGSLPQLCVGDWLDCALTLSRLLDIRNNSSFFNGLKDQEPWTVKVDIRGEILTIFYQFNSIGLNSNCLETLSRTLLDKEIPADIKDSGEITISLPLRRRLAAGYATPKAASILSNYLADETKRIFREDCIQMNFYRGLVPIFSNLVDTLDHEYYGIQGWLNLYHLILDQQFGLNAEWLFSATKGDPEHDRHPRGSVHALLNAVERVDPQNLNWERIAELQQWAMYLLSSMHLLSKDTYQHIPTNELELVAELKLLLGTQSERPQLAAPAQVYANISRNVFFAGMSSILHNAEKIVDLMPGKKRSDILVVLSKDDFGDTEDANPRTITITISNPTDEDAAKKAQGTGIGEPYIHHLFEKLTSYGSVKSESKGGYHTVTIRLPLVSAV